MAYFSSVTKSRALLGPATIPLIKRLSLRYIKGIAVGLLFITSFGFLLFWQPTFQQLRSLQDEKSYWQEVLELEVGTPLTAMPTMDQLPDIIEQCREVFVKEGVDVVSLNVERFGERLETGNPARLDYSLVRLNLHGNWQGIVTSLQALEETPQAIRIHVQEVVLDAEGGETLLQIYFVSR